MVVGSCWPGGGGGERDKSGLRREASRFKGRYGWGWGGEITAEDGIINENANLTWIHNIHRASTGHMTYKSDH